MDVLHYGYAADWRLVRCRSDRYVLQDWTTLLFASTETIAVSEWEIESNGDQPEYDQVHARLLTEMPEPEQVNPR